MKARELFEFKRLIDIASILVILGALLVLDRPNNLTTVSAAGFSDFPVDVGRTIDFDADDADFDLASPREKIEQIRDWLMFTLVSSGDLSAEEATQVTFDLPAVRRDYLRPLSRSEFGEMRSAFFGNGLVVALIPPGDKKTQADMLARIADEHRKNLGVTPELIAPFEYKITLDEQAGIAYADVTRRETLDARKFFSPEAGYYTKAITNADDLRSFLGQIDTLTYADARSGLTLGGRKLQGEKYLGVGFEDVAAIWQSDAAGSQKQGSGFSLDPTYDFVSLKKFFDEQLALVLSIGLDEPNSSTGWSPPWTPHLPQYPRNRFMESPLNRQSTAALAFDGDRIEKAGEALEKGDIAPLLNLFGELSRSKNEFALKIAARLECRPDEFGTRFLQAIDEKYGFQKARYDGALKETSVGMTLFYTDLLAKLWMFDYLGSTPTNRIDDFKSELEIKVSAAHEEESTRLANTRLWFGPQDKGYQVAGEGKELLLARTAARIYAAGSDPLTPDKESEPSTQAGAFLNWWDSHYDEIARFEPQYQRLNEIMKWSLLVGWLHREGVARVDFLRTPQVHDSRYWFSDWVKTQAGLRFTQWDDKCPPDAGAAATRKFTNVSFFPKGYKNSSTEALPLLQSKSFEYSGEKGWTLTGGVSLADRAVFLEREALSEWTKIGPLLRRSNLNYSVVEGTAEARALRTFEGVNYRFSAAGDRALVSGTAKQGAQLRDSYGGFVRDITVDRSLQRTPSGLSIETKTQGVSIGDLQIVRSENGFRVGYVSREIDGAQTLARQISRATDPDLIVASSTKLEAYIRTPGMQGQLVKLKGSQQWLRMEPGEASSGAGLQLRVADLGPSSRPYDLTWVRTEDAVSTLGNEGYVAVQVPGKGGAIRVESVAGKVPEGTTPFERTVNGAVVRGRLNAQRNELFIARRDLPASALSDPVELSRAIRSELPEPPLVSSLGRGDYRAAIQDMARDPLLARAQLSRHLEQGLVRGKKLLGEGKYDEALEQFDKLIDVHGERPELTTLRALARINKRSPAVATQVRGAWAAVNDHDGTAMLNEINARLRTGGLTPRGDTIEILSVRNHLTLGYKTPRLSNLTRTSPLSVNEPAVIFIEDSRGLNNIDWHVNTLPSLEEAVRLQQGVFYKVSDLKLGSFRPSMLFVESDSVVAGSQPLRFRAYYPRSLYLHTSCDPENKKDRDCEPQAYVFVARRAG